MDDPRLTPARPDLAAKYLEGKVKAARFVDGEEFEIIEPIAPLREAPSADAMLLTQALKGERVTIYDRNGEGWAWGQLEQRRLCRLASRCARWQSRPPRRRTRSPRSGPSPFPALRSNCRRSRRWSMGATADGDARGRHLRGDARGLVSAAAASRRHRRHGAGFRRGRRTLRRHALSVGRQEQPRHRLLRPGPGLAERRRHRLPARQRHAAGRPRPGAGAARNRRSCSAAI